MLQTLRKQHHPRRQGVLQTPQAITAMSLKLYHIGKPSSFKHDTNINPPNFCGLPHVIITNCRWTIKKSCADHFLWLPKLVCVGERLGNTAESQNNKEMLFRSITRLECAKKEHHANSCTNSTGAGVSFFSR